MNHARLSVMTSNGGNVIIAVRTNKVCWILATVNKARLVYCHLKWVHRSFTLITLYYNLRVFGYLETKCFPFLHWANSHCTIMMQFLSLSGLTGFQNCHIKVELFKTWVMRLLLVKKKISIHFRNSLSSIKLCFFVFYYCTVLSHSLLLFVTQTKSTTTTTRSLPTDFWATPNTTLWWKVVLQHPTGCSKLTCRF